MKKVFSAIALLAITGSTIAQNPTPRPQTPTPTPTTPAAPGGGGLNLGGINFGGAGQRTAPKPYKEVITDKAVTKKGLFTVHKIEDKF